MAPQDVRTLKTREDVVGAVGQDVARPLRVTDCLRIMPYPGHSDYWVSTPNMEVIPELPEQNPREPISYHADGMLALFEHLKWPQKFYLELPHAMAAPANPDFIHFQSPTYHDVDDQDFMVHDSLNELPEFRDAHIPWLHFKESRFEVTEDVPGAVVGRLKTEVVVRMKDAFSEAVKMFTPIADRLVGAAVQDAGMSTSRLHGLVNYFQANARRAGYACGVIARGNLSPFHTILWFREFQRLLLDLRAVIIYMEVVKPRLDDPSCNHSAHPLPLRGIITDKELFAAELFRVGVPVWLVRRTGSLTTDTYIRRMCKPVPVGVAFSTRRGMHYGHQAMTAPLWSQAPNDDPSVGNVLSRLQRFSVTNHAVVGAVKEYQHDDVDRMEREKVEEVEVVGPDVLASQLDGLDIQDPGAHLQHEESEGNEIGWQDNRDEVTFGVAASAQDPVVAPPTTGTSPVSVDAGRVSEEDGEKPKQRPLSSNRPCDRPSWVPQEAAGWSAAADASWLGDEPELRKHYHLPPPHLFFKLSADSPGALVRIHNWLRIRAWCIQQVVQPAAHGMVLMSAQDWRLALEGKYVQVRHAVAVDEDSAEASRRALDLHRLPVDSATGERPPKRRKQDIVLKDNSRARQQKDRMAGRGQVNVRFGIHAGYTPYTDETKARAFRWRRSELRYDDLKGAAGVWAEIVWELSVLNFRLELLQLDRILCSDLYDAADGGFGRSLQVTGVWAGDGTVELDWTGGDALAFLSASSQSTQHPAWQRLAEVVRRWPGGDILGDQTTRVEQEETGVDRVFLFYIQAAHRVLNRLPTIPFAPPVAQ